ncbi:sigma-E processing peptidase SpoIIGA [Mycoplasmatota bacterium]|nr:sigma-E processing peptidase SpoIIGA [Mycoplasmatota bacterium]
MTIYIDLIILSNFLLDYSLITYTGIIANEKIKFIRIFLATLFALSSLSLFFIQIQLIFIILRLLYSFIIILIAFSFVSLRKYIKNILLFYFVNYVMAGIITSYDFRFTSNAINIDLKQPTTWYLLIISFLIANILTYIYKVIEENHAFYKFNILDIRFRFLNKDYEVKGLIDTGNKTVSHGDNIPVIFIDKNIINTDIDEIYLLKNKVKFTYILMNTVKDSYITLAFKPENFGVVIDDQYFEKEVYLAIGQNIKNKDQSFQAILNSKILT